MSETKQKTSGPKAYEVHPVPVREVVAEQPSQPANAEQRISSMREQRRVRQMERDADEIARMDVEEEKAERRVRIREFQAREAELNARLGTGGPVDTVNRGAEEMDDDMSDMSLADAQKLAELPQEKQDAVMKIYAMSKAMKGAGSMAMLPLMMSFAAQPGTRTDDVTRVGEAMLGALQTGIELASPKGGSDSGSITEQLLLKAFDKLVDKPAATSTPQGDALDLVTKLKDLGLVYTPAQVTEMMRDEHETWAAVPTGSAGPSPDIELKRLDLDTQVKLAEIKSHSDLELAKLGLDKQKTEAVSGGLLKIANTIGRAVATGELDELDDAAGGGPEKNAPQGAVAERQCPSCKKPIMIPQPEKAREITCVGCGAVLNWNPQAK